MFFHLDKTKLNYPPHEAEDLFHLGVLHKKGAGTP